MKHSNKYRTNHGSQWSREIEQINRHDDAGTRFIVLCVLLLTLPPLFNILPVEYQAALINCVSMVLRVIHFVSSNVKP